MKNQEVVNGLYACIDWLEFTISELDSSNSQRQNIKYYLHLFGLQKDMFDEQGKGGLGYRRSMRHLSENIFIYFDGAFDMGIHFRISGTSVAYLLNRYLESMAVDTPFGKGYEIRDKDIRGAFRNAIHKSLNLPTNNYDYDVDKVCIMFLQKILEVGHFTRIDLALDDVGAVYFTVNDVFKLVDNCQVSCKFKKWQNVKSCSFKDGCIGHTVYFGSRESDVYLRVYEKAYEQNIKEINWTRWELEIKHDKADLFVKELINNQYIGSVTIGLLSNYIRFIKKDSERNARCSTLPLWKKFIGDVEKLRLKLPEKVRTIEDKQRWIDKQCMPTLAGLIVSNGGDISFLRDNLENHFERLKAKDKEMYLEALMKGGVDYD